MGDLHLCTRLRVGTDEVAKRPARAAAVLGALAACGYGSPVSVAGVESLNGTATDDLVYGCVTVPEGARVYVDNISFTNTFSEWEKNRSVSRMTV